MNLLVFGATGGTGRECVQQALARQWRVTAFVRDPARLDVAHARLGIVQGDVRDANTLSLAFAAARFDACISALGVYHSGPSVELSEGTRNVVAALERHDVMRLVLISTLGAAESRSQGSLFVKLYTRTLLRHVLADKARQEALVRASRLRYTILRPPQLVDAPAGHRPMVSWQAMRPRDADLSWKISRADVATFALDAIDLDRHVGAAVQLSWARR